MMTKSEFLLVLEKELAPLTVEERNKTITYYSELISDMIENGYTQEEAVEKLGKPEDIAREIILDSKEEKVLNPEPKVEVVKKETPVQQELKNKKKIKAWPFILGGVLLIVIISIIQIVQFINFDKSPREKVVLEYDVSTINNIDIDIDVDNLKVVNSTTDKIVLEYYTNKRFEYEVELEGSSLEVDGDFEYSLFANYNIEEYSTTLYLPITYTKNINLNNDAGLIQIESTNIFNNVEIENSAGLISLKNLVCNNLMIEQSTGQIDLINIKANGVLISSSAGQVKFDNLDANNINIEVTTGSVDGKFVDDMSNYTISTSTTAGNSNLPESYGNGPKKLVIETTLGSINVKFNK